MLKFLIILGVVAYILYKFASFFYHAGASSQRQRRAGDDTINIDPNAGPKKKGSKYKGGEYIDYEEVK